MPNTPTFTPPNFPFCGATHVRVGTPWWFPVAMGVLLWAGLCLRHPRLRALVLAPSAA